MFETDPDFALVVYLVVIVFELKIEPISMCAELGEGIRVTSRICLIWLFLFLLAHQGPWGRERV
jgi:hypothetical protein